MLIISNSSPLIALSRIGRLDILKSLYGKIFIPKAVEKEIRADPIRKIDLNRLSWIKVKVLNQSLSSDILSVNLGLGESETIALALELKAELVILDELAGRNMAESLNLKFTGTLGVLLKAKKKGLIPSVKELIDALNKHEFRISPQLYQNILELSKEV